MNSATTIDVEPPAAAPEARAPKRERKTVHLVRRTLGLRRFLSTPIDPLAARLEVQRRLEHRDDHFLECVRELVFEAPHSPYRPLLAAAGWSFADVETSVRRHGIEGTLERLRDAGVYVSLDEWKGRDPLVRNGVELHLKPEDFDNPLIGRDLEASSSGSSGAASRTPAAWEGLTELAKRSRVMLDMCGLGDAKTAIWMPAPPGGSGLVGVVMLTKIGMRPERWFAMTRPTGSLLDRFSALFLLVAARLLGHPLPWPRYTELGDAEVVARWLAGDPPRALFGFASSTMRVGRAAQELGLDLSGRAVFVGGEPVTPDRQAFLRSLGLRVVAGYGASDAGGIGTGCLEAGDVDDYHVQLDQVALIAGPDAPEAGPVPLLVSSFVKTNGKVLLNVDLGDEGVLERRACGCPFGDQGYDVHVSHVRSRAKQTSEGMTVPSRVLWEHAGEVLASAGAGRDDFQIWEVQGDDGLSRVVLAVSPHLEIDEEAVVRRILDDFGRRDPGSKTAAEVWRQAGTLRVVRERPRLSGGGKLLPVLAFDAESELEPA